MADSKNPFDDVPWPEKSDRIFSERPKPKPLRETGSLAFDQILESLSSDADYFYRVGYYEAARILASKLAEGEHQELYFPMLFCFRHYVELSLKCMVGVYAKLQDEDINARLAKTHDVMRLWNETKRLINMSDIKYSSSTDVHEAVDRCMKELDDVDRSSQTFRYATDTANKRVDDCLAPVDVPQFIKTMENLHSFFDASEDHASEWTEWKQEESYY